MGAGVATPTPEMLTANAAELRQLAGHLRRMADQCEHVLDGVSALDDASTWQGPYAARAGRTLGDWRSGLTSTANEMRATAASWDRIANNMDQQAAEASKVQPAPAGR
jgi:uncharacterized protein YukE